ncbi:MAG: hypothetical protein K2F57_00740, partial [Candidatus Gastranaerophilales bacterium]|nr:hypothetical protein [Candidatus Gastranaerophilales bacterium]
MGMAASQARLLSITARLSNNEMEQQSLAYSKQRLSDNSEQINDAYLEALNKTKYQILTGYNNTEACYADLTYNQLTGCGSVASGKQYLVKDKTGKVVVPSNVAKAFEANNGDFNRFLRDLGYTQSDINVKNRVESEEAIHNAWDRYLSSVGKSIDNLNDGQHILGFDYASFSSDSFDGYVTYDTAYATDKDGKQTNLYRDSIGYYKERYTLEARRVVDENTGELKTEVGYQTKDQEGTNIWQVLEDVRYNTESKKFIYTNLDGEEVQADALYADPDEDLISEDFRNYLEYNGGDSYLSEGGVSYTITKQAQALNFEGTSAAQRELFDYATALTEAYYNNPISNTSETLTYDKEMVNYYKNIFNEMRTKGHTTIQNETNFKDADWFVKRLKAGDLTLSYYSIAEKSFIGTTLDNDESITEKEDTSAMAIAEQVYQNRMDKIQSQDKQIDLQLNKLESEHNALSTEYDSVKKIISQ